MSMASRGARISMTDVSDLNVASEDLAAVAELIKRNRPSYQDAAVQLLIRANTTIVRIQNKGAAAYARYLERHGLTGRGSIGRRFDQASARDARHAPTDAALPALRVRNRRSYKGDR